MALGLLNNSILVWDYETFTVKNVFLGNTGSVTMCSVKFLSDGRLAAQSPNQTIYVWNVTTGSVDLVLNGTVYWLEELWNGLLASTGSDKTIKIWNLTNGSLVNTMIPSPRNPQNVLKQTNVNNYLASGDTLGFIFIWNTTNYSLVKILKEHTLKIAFFKSLSNGLLLSGAKDFLVKLWNITNGTCLTTYNPFGTRVYAAALGPNNTIAIVGNSSYLVVTKLDSSNSIVEKARVNMYVPYVNNMPMINNNIILVAVQGGCILYLDLKNLTIIRNVSVVSNEINYVELNSRL